jgi:hypothetical protein
VAGFICGFGLVDEIVVERLLSDGRCWIDGLMAWWTIDRYRHEISRISMIMKISLYPTL